MADYDSIIIGAGHNGLVCAAYLARAGQRVLILEAADSPGGLAANREFHPGFNVPVAHSLCHFSATVTDDLKLEGHGFQPASRQLATIGLAIGQSPIIVANGTVDGVGAEDAQAYRRYREQMQDFAQALQPFWHQTMPRIGNNSFGEVVTFAKLGLKLRRLGKEQMREFLRIVTLPVRDLMDENFNSDALKSILSWDGLAGAKLAPRSPNSAVLAMLYRMAGASRGEHSVPATGIQSLIRAIQKSAESAGTEIRCATPVERILVTDDNSGLVASGVRIANGETISSDRVISTADPKRTFLQLVGVERFDIGFTNRVRRLRSDGYVGKLHLALNSAPAFSGLEGCGERMLIAPTMDHIEFAFDNAKYGELPDEPVLEVLVPSVHEQSLSTNGRHVLSAQVMYVPFQAKGGWTDELREKMCGKAIDAIAAYAPDIREQIVGQEFLTPADLEREYRVTGGHWHHTEFAIDQMLMMRPTYEAAQYGTPIPGLYLSGAGSHPGGDVTGIPGYNAAHEILR